MLTEYKSSWGNSIYYANKIPPSDSPLKSILPWYGESRDDRGGDDEHLGSKRPREYEVAKEKKKRNSVVEEKKQAEYTQNPDGKNPISLPIVPQTLSVI